MSLNNSQASNNIIRSRSPDQYQSSHKRGRPRRHTLPTTLLRHHSIVSHPYFSQHTHHLCITSDDSIDTSSLKEGILFYQNPNNGEIDYCWENELDTCTPSLMPENNEMLSSCEISGDSLDVEEKYFQIMAKELNKQRTQRNGENQVEATKDVDTDDDMEILRDENIENDELKMDNLVKEMNELFFDQELKEREEREELRERGEREESEEEEPLSPLSPRDPERESLVLSEEEEDTEEGGLYRLEHDPEFQDEAGLDTEDSGGTVWTDDEGMDPMENQ